MTGDSQSELPRSPRLSILTALHTAIAGGLFACVIVLSAWRMTPGVVGTYHDDAIYVSTAKALAEGRGYRLIGLPGEPFQTKYPVLYPAVLSSLWALWPAFPANLVLLQCVSIVCAAASVAGSYLFLVRFDYARTWEAAAAAAMAATASSLLYFATQTLSEPFFSLCLVVSLWLVERSTAAPSRPPTDFLLGASLALPLLSRTVGATSLLSGAWSLLRSRRLSAWVLGGAGLVASVWGLWVVAHMAPDATAAAYYTGRAYADWWSYASLNVLALNALWLVFDTGHLPAEVLTHSSVWPIPVTFGLAAWMAILIAAVRGRSLAVMLTTYAALILIWPWPPHRFLVPLLPFLTFYLVRSCRPLAGRLPVRARTTLAGLITCLILSSNLWLVIQQARLARSTGYPYGVIVSDGLVSWHQYQQVFLWIRENTGPADVLASGLDSMVALFTDRHAIRPFVDNPLALFYGSPDSPIGTVDDVMRTLRAFDVRYVVDLPMPGFSEAEPLREVLAAATRKYPGCFSDAYRQDGDHRFAVLAVHLSACGD